MLRRNFQAEIARARLLPLEIAGRKIFDLAGLLEALQTLESSEIQSYSDNDVFSSWLDRKGYPELAEELRPIHGSGPGLCRTLAGAVSRWTETYRQRGLPLG